jgi:uncharacterized protein
MKITKPTLLILSAILIVVAVSPFITKDVYWRAVLIPYGFTSMALLSEIIGTVAGFGSSVLFVPLAQFYFGFQVVLMLTSILHVFSNISKIALFWRYINWRFCALYGIPSLIFSVLGAYLTDKIALTYGEAILGVFLLVFSCVFLLFPSVRFFPTTTNAVTSGGVAGFLAGFIGTGGAVRGMSMAAFNLEKNTFVATSGAIDFGVDFSRMLVYLGNGFLNASLWMYIPLLLIASVIGTLIGKKVLDGIPDAAFKKIVLILIALIGLTLLFKTFY